MDRLAEVPPIMASICMDSEGLDGVRASRLFRFAIIHFFSQPLTLKWTLFAIAMQA